MGVLRTHENTMPMARFFMSTDGRVLVLVRVSPACL